MNNFEQENVISFNALLFNVALHAFFGYFYQNKFTEHTGIWLTVAADSVYLISALSYLDSYKEFSGVIGVFGHDSIWVTMIHKIVCISIALCGLTADRKWLLLAAFQTAHTTTRTTRKILQKLRLLYTFRNHISGVTELNVQYCIAYVLFSCIGKIFKNTSDATLWMTIYDIILANSFVFEDYRINVPLIAVVRAWPMSSVLKISLFAWMSTTQRIINDVQFTVSH